ncbi:MAG: mechanosensitive ion channel, partial [Armatimonadetes bacterium]|nr:mechanosensitive ion channel [Armatimonadota bacterium]
MWLRALCLRPLAVARHGGFGQEWLLAVTASLQHHAVPLALTATVVALLTQLAASHQAPALLTLFRALLLLLVVRLLGRSVLAPFPPAEPFSGLAPDIEQSLARRLRLLTLVLVFGYLLFTTARQLGLPAQPYLLARALFVALLAINLYRLLRLRARLADNPAIAAGRALAVAVLALVVGAELLGYRHLSSYLLRGVVGTLVVVPLFWLVRRLLLDTLGRVGRGELSPLHRRLRLPADEGLPGLVWLHLLAGLLLWPGLALVLLRVWLSPTGFANALEHLRQGIGLGGLVFLPVRGLLGLGVLAVLMLATRWLCTWLESFLGGREQLDPGARAASITLTGYAGVILAATAAASTMGFSLTQVTVLFGALSVGIGFGLQNIVNNFVSGLILLFERPIQAGDWIKVGDTEGYVRRLSVRSTQIENLDREQIIIPNSDLLTKPVINRTLASRGQVSVVVGLPYGTEPARAEAILREAAATVPAIEPDSVEVQLKGLGAQALQFELRCRPREEQRRQAAEA